MLGYHSSHRKGQTKMKKRTQTENILEMHPETRSSDKMLMMRVWETQGLYLSPAQQELFIKVTSPETITRIRRKLQEMGKYPATDKVKADRRFKSLQAEVIAPKDNPEWLQGILGY